jgi:hypothetical protein
MAAYQCLNCGQIECSGETCCPFPFLFRINDMPSEILRLRAGLQYFVDRVDAGEIQSRTTYAKFKELLKIRS